MTDVGWEGTQYHSFQNPQLKEAHPIQTSLFTLYPFPTGCWRVDSLQVQLRHLDCNRWLLLMPCTLILGPARTGDATRADGTGEGPASGQA